MQSCKSVFWSKTWNFVVYDDLNRCLTGVGNEKGQCKAYCITPIIEF